MDTFDPTSLVTETITPLPIAVPFHKLSETTQRLLPPINRPLRERCCARFYGYMNVGMCLILFGVAVVLAIATTRMKNDKEKQEFVENLTLLIFTGCGIVFGALVGVRTLYEGCTGKKCFLPCRFTETCQESYEEANPV